MILIGDCFEKLKDIEDNSIHSLVTDPPYGLSTITEQDTRDCLAQWLADEVYTSQKTGFMGESWDSFVPSPVLFREVLRVLKPGAYGLVFSSSRTQDLMTLSLRLAGFEIRDCLMWLYGKGFPKTKQSLKPAYEPITLVRKHLNGTTSSNVFKHGTGKLNIDACRFGSVDKSKSIIKLYSHKGLQEISFSRSSNRVYRSNPKGRYPTNIITDGSLDLKHANRYFYCSKATTEEKHKGTDRNIHPTVKPINLMRYLCKLITPEEGTILDPFAGSGSTLCAAVLEGFKPLGIERNPEYAAIAEQRLNHYTLDKEWSLF